MVNVPINFQIQGARVSDQFDELTESIEKTRREVDKFAKSGSLGAFTAGKSEIKASIARLDMLAIEAGQAEEKIHSLYKEMISPEVPGQVKRSFQAIQDEIDLTIARATVLEAELTRLPIELKRTVIANKVDFLGDLGTGFSSLGGATAGIGASPLGRIGGLGLQTGVGPLANIGGGFQLAGDLFDVAEALPRMSSALDIAKTATLDYVNAAGGLKNVFSNLLVTMGPMALAAGASSAAFIGLKLIMDSAKESAKDAIEASRETIRLAEVEREIQDSSLADIEERIALTKLEIADREKAKEAAIEEFEANGQQREGVLAGIQLYGDLLFGLKDINGELENYNKQIKESYNDLTKLNAVLADKKLSAQLEQTREANERRVQSAVEWQHTLDSATSESIQQQVADNEYVIRLRKQDIESQQGLLATLETTTEAYATLSDMLGENIHEVSRLEAENQRLNQAGLPLILGREREALLMEKQTDLLGQLTSAREQSAAIDKQIRDMQAQQAGQAVRQAEQNALKASQTERLTAKQMELAGAQEAQKAQEQSNKLVAIRTTGAQKEQDILNKLQTTEAQAVAKLGASVDKINRDFMASELKATIAFRNQELDALEDYNIERLRLVTDLSDSLLQAATDNDVNAFISAQREGLRGIGDLDTDFGISGARSSRDFLLEREQASQARQQQLADLQTTFTAERDERARAAVQQLADTRAQTEAQLTQTREAGKAHLSETERIQREIQDLQLQFARETGELQARYEREGQARRLLQLQQSELAMGLQFASLNSSLVANSAALANNVGASFVNGITATMNTLFGQFFGGIQQGVNVNVGTVQVGSVVSRDEMNQQLNAVSSSISNSLTQAFNRTY